MAISTIDAGKELPVAYRPVVLCEFTFLDSSTLFVCTHNGDGANGGYAYNGANYLPMVDDQAIDRLAQLSEMGIDRVPSITVKLADPSGTLLASYERGAGKGFKGATVLMRLVLFDPETGSYSSDYIVPFVGICDPPAYDGKDLVVTAQSLLNLGRYMLPTVPIQTTCPWINPVNAAQKAEATDPNSPFYPCGETRSGVLPCQYTNGTCTQPTHRGNVTFDVKATGQGVNYQSGKTLDWANADTSNKYNEYWPLWLGGMAWLEACVLNMMGDGNYTRGEVAVGFGSVTIPDVTIPPGTYVVVNGEQLWYNGDNNNPDYVWDYVNAGQQAGTPCQDAGYNGQGDPYGNLTAIEVRTPSDIWSPSSLPSVKILAYPPSMRAAIAIVSASASGGVITVQFGTNPGSYGPGTGQTVTIIGCGFAAANGVWVLNYAEPPYDHAELVGSNATGSGAGGTMWYDTVRLVSQTGSVPTPWVMRNVLDWCGIGDDRIDGASFTAAAAICMANGFYSAMVLRQRRSAADIMRGLRQSIGAALIQTAAGLIGIRMEGPLAEQQPAPVDGSNYNSPIASQQRDGTPANGYAAYLFNQSNSNGLQRVAQKAEALPNTVSFPFQDPVNNYTVSTYTQIDPDDVTRMGRQIPGALQVQPEGIASYGMAQACATLGLNKILRGNGAGDTRGTEWWAWKSSFRGCRLGVGDIVLLNYPDFGLSNQLIRLTEVSPSRNYETVTFKGHWHSCTWYMSAGAVPAPGLGATIPPANLSGERTVTVSGTQLLGDECVSFDTSGIAGSTTALSAAMDAVTTAASVASGANITNGTYIQIDSEIMYVTAGQGTTGLTVTRGALNTTAASHASAATVNVAGILTFTLLSIASAPSRDLILRKVSTDLNAVVVHTSGGNTFPGGSNTLILADAQSRGTSLIHFPSASSNVLVVIGGAGPAGASGQTAAGTVLFQDVALTANTQIVSPQNPIDDQILVVYIEQGGGWNITWAAAFKNAPAYIDQDAGSVSVFEFVGHGGYWWYTNTGSLTTPALPSSIALSEVGTRILVGPLNRTQATLQVTWTDPAIGPPPVTVHYALNMPAGTEGASGEAPVQTSGATRFVQFSAWAPTANQSGSVTIALETSTTTSLPITSAAVTINAIGSAAANNVSGLTVTAPVYVADADGHWYFSFTVSAANALGDPNFFTSKITACWGSITGGVFTPAADQPSPVSAMDGLEFQTAAYSILWGGFPVFSAADHTVLRIQAWSQSRSQAGATPMTWTAQTTAVGGTTDHVDITPVLQAARIPSQRIDPTSLGANLGKDGTGRMQLTPASITQAAIYPGALSDPMGGAWGALAGPPVVNYGLPSWTAYNTGQILVDNSSPIWKIYRNSGYPNGWVAATDPADVSAGSLAAGVVLTGSVTVVSGTVTVNIDGTNFVRVSDADSSYPRSVQLTNVSAGASGSGSSGQKAMAVVRIPRQSNAPGELFLQDATGGQTLRVIPSFQSGGTMPSTAAGYLSIGVNGATYLIPYVSSS